METKVQEEQHLQKATKGKKQKKKFNYHMKYFAWILLVVPFTVALMLYGFQFDKEQSAQWLCTMLITFLLGFALLIYMIVKKLVDDEDGGVARNVAENKDIEPDCAKELIQEKPFWQWALPDGFCFLFYFDKNAEKVIAEKVSRYNENNELVDADFEKEEIQFPSRRFIRLKGLKNEVYQMKVTVEGVEKKRIITIEFKCELSHRIQNDRFQAHIHCDGVDRIRKNLQRKDRPIEVFIRGYTTEDITEYYDWFEFCQSRFHSFTHRHTTTYANTLEDWDNLVVNNWKRSYTLVDLVAPPQHNYGWKNQFISVLLDYFKRGTFIFENYDINGHFDFFRYKDDELDFCRSLWKGTKHILIFIPEHFIMLMVDVIDTSNMGDEDVLISVNNSFQCLSNDILKFASMHYEFVSEGFITIIPLLALPNYTKLEYDEILEKYASFPNCKECESTIMFKELLSNFDSPSFKSWWGTIVQKIQRDVPKTEETRRMHMKLLAHIIGFMSSADVPYVPGVFDEDAKCIQKISLTKIQYEIFSTTEKHLLIRGGYGSGKSLICQLKLHNMVDTVDSGAKIYFLCHDSKSLLLHHMENLSEKLCEKIKREGRNVEVVTADFEKLASHFNVKNITLVQFLDLISRESGNHIIMDEYDAVTLTKRHAGDVNRILQRPTMKDSIIWIAVKPLSKYRRKIIGKQSNTLVSEGYEFEHTGIKVKSLGKIFRNSRQIHQILNETKKVIEESLTKFTYEEESFFFGERIIEDDTETSVIRPKSRAIGISGGTSVSPERVVKEGDYDELDCIFKACRQLNRRENNAVIETRFQIYGVTDSCSKVEGMTPILVSPFQSGIFGDINFEMIFRAYIAISHIIKVRSKTVAIICTDVYEAFICVEAMKLSSEFELQFNVITYLPTIFPGQGDLRRNFQWNSKRHTHNIIVTDSAGITGLEFEKVVVCVTPSEHFLSHTLVGSLSRSMSDLYFLEFPQHVPDSDVTPITREVIKAWKDKNLVRESTIVVQGSCTCYEEDCVEPYIMTKAAVKSAVDHTYLLCRHSEMEKIQNNYEAKILAEKVTWETKTKDLYGTDKRNMVNMMHEFLKEEISH